MRVVMLLSNGYWPDWRVQKEAHTLALAGYQVTIIAWDRERRFPPHELETLPPALDSALADWPGRVTKTPQPVVITRVRVPAGYRTGRRLLGQIPAFWWRAFQELRRSRPAIVHANDLDTLPVGYLYSRMAGARLIYDAHEYYPGMVRANVGARASAILDRAERWLAPRADVTLTVGERLRARFESMGARAEVILNSQPLPDPDAIRKAREMTRRALGIPDAALLVVYVGYLTPNRLLTPVVEAAEHLDHVWLVVGGIGPQFESIQAASRRCARIKALGWVPVEDAPAIVAASDVVYYGLDAANPNSYYYMPNLAFHALAAGRPLVTTPVGEIAEIVQREQVGVVMDAATPMAARRALERLTDAHYRVTLARQARYICQTKYHWQITADRLLAAYRSC